MSSAARLAALLCGLLACAVLAPAGATSMVRPLADKGHFRAFLEDAIPAAPLGWRQMARTSDDHVLSLIFAVKQSNLDALERKFWAVSDPKSPSYGKFLSLEELSALVGRPESTKTVKTWISSFGVKDADMHVPMTGDFVKARVPCSVAREMLQADFHEFEHIESGIRTHNALSYSVPLDIADHLDFVGGISKFHRIQRLAGRTYDLEAPPNGGAPPTVDDRIVTPQVLVDFYNINPNTATSSKGSQSVFESLGQYYSPADLKAFFTKFGIPQMKVAKVIGPNKEYNPGGEANLDIQYIMAVAVNVPTWFWSITASETSDPFLEYMTALSDHPDAPLVHSFSYGGIESMVGAAAVNRINVEFQKGGVRGLSFVFASGDDGVASYMAREDPSKCEPFNADYPGSSPFVTTVGATQFGRNGGEVACSVSTGASITTGGGFSSFMARPAYQDKAVQAYLDRATLPPVRDFKKANRGYPDVALAGHKYAIYLGGRLIGVDGTSASTPVFAAMLSLVNDARLTAGLPPVGFVNPLLYSLHDSNPDIFNDVTSGDNKCIAWDGAGKPFCCRYGFTATEGWDPVSGLGSLDFAKFRDAAMQAAPSGSSTPVLAGFGAFKKGGAPL
eukprot:tig00000881_g5221.t1